MISKSQFVIFSALLAYQGMVGAPESPEKTAVAQAPTVATPSAAAASAKTPAAAPKPETYEEKINTLTAESVQAENNLAVIQGQFDQQKLSVDILERIIAAGEEGEKLTWEQLGKMRISIAGDEYAQAKAKFSESEAMLERLREDADQVYKSIEENAAGPKDPKAALLGGAFSNWRRGEEPANVKHAEELVENLRDEVDEIRGKIEDAVDRYSKKNKGNLATEVAQLKKDAALAKNDLPRAKKALAQSQTALDFRKRLAVKAHAELEKAIADKTIAEENKKRDAADAKIKADAADAKKKADAADAQKKADAADAQKKADAAKKADEAQKKTDADKKAEKEAESKAAAQLAADEKAKNAVGNQTATTASAAAPAVATTEVKTFTAAEAAPIAKKLAAEIFAGDKAKIPEAEKKIAQILMLGERLKKAEEKAAPKKQEKTEKKSDKPKKLRRLGEEDKKAAAEKTSDHIGNVIATALKQARHILAQLQQIHGAQLQNVNNQADFTKLEADAKQAGEAISKAEALIKLREDNTAKADDLKKAKATVLGLGLGLGLGIPVLVAVVFTVLVKTNRVLLNFGSSATVSADV